MFEDLVRLVQPPVRQSVAIDWASVEYALGVRRPDDYKRLAEVYGLGSFDDFIHIFQPQSRYDTIDLIKQRAADQDNLQSFVTHGEELPCDPSMLLPAGRTDNGETI